MTRRTLLLILCAAGCGPTKPKLADPVPVTGKLTTPAGKPLTNAVVTLHPADDGSTEGAVPSGPVDAEGGFKLKARPGKYKVTVVKLAAGTAGSGGGMAAAPVLNPKADAMAGMSRTPVYNDFKSTPLELVVPEGGATGVTFKVDL